MSAPVRKVFWEDPYRTSLSTRVRDVHGDEVRVRETIFFAFSGGQESDAGTLGGQPVLDARTDGPDIVYTLAPGHGLSSGTAVEIEIDWPRRYALMRLHFAAELVLEIVYRQLGPLHKAGAHIAADKARIDFEYPGNIAARLPAIEAQARALVAADRPIVSRFTDELAGQRCWEVAGFARVACGGTHLRRTGEVGELRLRRRNPGRGLERIEVRVDDPPGA